jgi:hypothetical protein
MTDTATMAPAVATDAVPSSPATDTVSNVARDANGRFAPAESTTVEPPADPETPATDGTPAETPETEATAKETPEQKSEKDRKRASAQDRINQLTAQKHDKDRLLNEATRKIREQAKQIEALQEDDPNDPFGTRRAVKLERFEQSKEDFAQAREAAQQASINAFSAKISVARESMPDIDQHVQVFGQIPLSNAACEVIASSAKAAEIAYFIGRNPNEGYRIANLPIYQQTAEIARLEAKLTTPEPKRVSTAPKPAQTLGGGVNPLQFDASRGSVDDMAVFLKKAGVIR